MRVSEWQMIEGYASFRYKEGGNPDNVEDRVAFIEKTPRVFNGQKWVHGPKGQAPEYQPSRDWCDMELVKLGYTLEEPAHKRAIRSLVYQGAKGAVRSGSDVMVSGMLTQAKFLDQLCRAMPDEHFAVYWRDSQGYNGTIHTTTKKSVLSCIDTVVEKHAYYPKTYARYVVNAYRTRFTRMTVGDVRARFDDQHREDQRCVNACCVGILLRVAGTSSPYLKPCVCFSTDDEGCELCDYYGHTLANPVTVPAPTEEEKAFHIEMLKPFLDSSEQVSGEPQRDLLPELSSEVLEYINRKIDVLCAEREEFEAGQAAIRKRGNAISDASYMRLAGVPDHDIMKLVGLDYATEG